MSPSVPVRSLAISSNRNPATNGEYETWKPGCGSWLTCKLNDSDFHTVLQILDSNIVMDSSEYIQNWFLWGERKNCSDVQELDVIWQHMAFQFNDLYNDPAIKDPYHPAYRTTVLEKRNNDIKTIWKWKMIQCKKQSLESDIIEVLKHNRHNVTLVTLLISSYICVRDRWITELRSKCATEGSVQQNVNLVTW